MTVEEIAKYLKDNEILRGAKVSFLAKGFTKEVFLVKKASQKYCFMVLREDIPQDNDLQHHFNSLKFLRKEGITFAPQPVHFDPFRKILITKFLEGKSCRC